METWIVESLFRIARTTAGYYTQLNAQELTEKDFKLWIDSLEEPMRTHFNKKGLDNCRTSLKFRRFILELQDKRLEEYLRNNLTEEDYSS